MVNLEDKNMVDNMTMFCGEGPREFQALLAWNAFLAKFNSRLAKDSPHFYLW